MLLLFGLSGCLEGKLCKYRFFLMNENLVEGELAEKIYLEVSGIETCRQYCIQREAVIFDRFEGFLNFLGVIVSQLQ